MSSDSSVAPPPPPPPPAAEEEVAEVYKCPNCGAPIEVTPDTIVVKCRYCGFTEYKGPGFEIYVVPSIPDADIEKIFWRRMRQDSDMSKYLQEISIQDITFIYVPYYVVNYSAEYYFIGERRETETYTVSVGGRTETRVRTKIVTVRDSGRRKGVQPILGRRHIEELGIKELSIQVSQLSFDNIVKAEDYKWGRKVTSVMGYDIEPGEVPLITKDVVAEHIKRWIYRKYRLDKLKAYLCRVNVESFKAILVPMFVITYKFRNGLYAISFSGVDGRQLVAVEPVLGKHMAMYVGGAGLLAFLAGASLPLASESMYFLIIPLIMGGLGFYLVRKALGGVRFER